MTSSAFDPENIYADKALARIELDGRAHYALWQNGSFRLFEGSPFEGGKPGSVLVPGDQVKVLSPCQPSKVVAVGLNYKAHAKEMNHDLPKEPLIFLKPSTAVIGPHEPVVRPLGATRVDYEAELAIVISKTCSKVDPSRALDYVMGYTCLNDVTERDLQAKDVQFTRGKSFDTFCPLGPVITKDRDPNSLAVKALVNGKVCQDSNTSDLIFPVEKIVSFVSKIMTLLPQDVIATGTPSGVGPLVSGDEVAIEIQGIGRLVNPVVDA